MSIIKGMGESEMEKMNEGEESYTMVIESKMTRYVCDICQKEYLTREDAEKCQEWCRRFTESPDITNLKLSPRTFNALYRAKIYTMRDLVNCSDEELLAIKGLGKKSVLEVKDKLKQYGKIK